MNNDGLQLFAPKSKADLVVYQCPNAGNLKCIYRVPDGERGCLICGPNAPKGTAQIMHSFRRMYEGTRHQAFDLMGMMERGPDSEVSSKRGIDYDSDTLRPTRWERFTRWLRSLRQRGGDEEWEGHFDYCEVFNGSPMNELSSSGKPCNEDCANHPGSKVFLAPSGEVWRR